MTRIKTFRLNDSGEYRMLEPLMEMLLAIPAMDPAKLAAGWARQPAKLADAHAQAVRLLEIAKQDRQTPAGDRLTRALQLASNVLAEFSVLRTLDWALNHLARPDVREYIAGAKAELHDTTRDAEIVFAPKTRPRRRGRLSKADSDKLRVRLYSAIVEDPQLRDEPDKLAVRFGVHPRTIRRVFAPKRKK